MTPLQIILTFAYLGGIGLLLTAGYRLLVRFGRRGEASRLAPTPERKEVGSTGGQPLHEVFEGDRGAVVRTSTELDMDQRVVVTDINMNFGSMVAFMVKWVIASIPAMLILVLLAGVLTAVVTGLMSVGP